MSLLRKTDLKKHMAPAIKRRVSPPSSLAAEAGIAPNSGVSELPSKEVAQTSGAHRSEDLASIKSKSDRA